MNAKAMMKAKATRDTLKAENVVARELRPTPLIECVDDLRERPLLLLGMGIRAKLGDRGERRSVTRREGRAACLAFLELKGRPGQHVVGNHDVSRHIA